MKHNEEKLVNIRENILDAIVTDIGLIEVESKRKGNDTILEISIDAADGIHRNISSIVINNSGKIYSELYNFKDNSPICTFNCGNGISTYEEEDLRNTLLEEKYFNEH